MSYEDEVAKGDAVERAFNRRLTDPIPQDVVDEALAVFGFRPGPLGDEDAKAAIDRLLAAQMDPTEPHWWWLSFCDPERPTGRQFLGAAMVQAPNSLMAVSEAHRLKINPGGEVALLDLSGVEMDYAKPWWNRLLSQAEIEEMDAALDTD